MIPAWKATLKALKLTNNPQSLSAPTACTLTDQFELIKRKQHTPLVVTLPELVAGEYSAFVPCSCALFFSISLDILFFSIVFYSQLFTGTTSVNTHTPCNDHSGYKPLFMFPFCVHQCTIRA